MAREYVVTSWQINTLQNLKCLSLMLRPVLLFSLAHMNIKHEHEHET